ncbi:catechol 1,2-dioxygenase [Actinomadura soli]|uniref:Catechol 1,2-dioxygenase n=1 Tax=Actinomadura soli TaxID=2508997 RepID=A0A5C4JHW2_9ACTN|nr:catechol 1,2-dioxygenase [Actinomadura soli]TMR04994.1 catechol 1,2-dioxygenase [Actinomadura soli]
MASIVLGVGASHSTLMNTHWDKVVHTERAEAFRAGLAGARARIAEARPDVVVVVGSNHFRGFWLDLIPSFTLGVGEVIAAGDGGTPKGPLRTDPGFARALAAGLVEAGTEVAISARLTIDHGQTHAVQWLLDGIDAPVVPLVVNVFAAPLPTMRRCVELGANLADAIARMPGDGRVVVVSSGGLSHQLPWPSDWTDPEGEDEEFLVEAWLNGRGRWDRYDRRRREIIVAAKPTIFTAFDEGFLRDLERGGLRTYADLGSDEIQDRAGNGGQELRTWMVMASALGFAPGRTLVYAPMPEWLTGMAAAVIDPAATPEPGRHREGRP